MTVKELLYECKQAIVEGHGDKQIYISADDEGNYFHKMYYGFTTSRADLEDFDAMDLINFEFKDHTDNIVILG